MSRFRKKAGDQGQSRPEDDAQKTIVKFLRSLEKFKLLLFFAVPNQLLRRKAMRLIFWALGCQAGVPDLVILLRGGRVIFIELKALDKNGKPGRLSTDQKAFHASLLEFGFTVYTVTAENPAHGMQRVADILRENGVAC